VAALGRAGQFFSPTAWRIHRWLDEPISDLFLVPTVIHLDARFQAQTTAAQTLT